MGQGPYPAQESPESARRHDMDWLQYTIIVLASFAATIALHELPIEQPSV